MEMLMKMAKNHRAVIQASTVYSSMIVDTGRKFVVRYWGEEGDLVVKRAERALTEIDSYRSPSRSMVFKLSTDQGEMWAVDVTYYGLD